MMKHSSSRFSGKITDGDFAQRTVRFDFGQVQNIFHCLGQ
jgi:hypothetical protein